MKHATIAFLATATLLSGCAANVSPTVETTGLQAQKVALGKIVALNHVSIKPKSGSADGSTAGLVAGGLAGSMLGHGIVARSLGAVAGAVGGAIAGKAIGAHITQTNGVQVTVRFPDGSLISVVQGEQTPPLYTGENVEVLYGSGTTRVLPAGRVKQ